MQEQTSISAKPIELKSRILQVSDHNSGNLHSNRVVRSTLRLPHFCRIFFIQFQHVSNRIVDTLNVAKVEASNFQLESYPMLSCPRCFTFAFARSWKKVMRPHLHASSRHNVGGGGEHLKYVSFEGHWIDSLTTALIEALQTTWRKKIWLYHCARTLDYVQSQHILLCIPRYVCMTQFLCL